MADKTIIVEVKGKNLQETIKQAKDLNVELDKAEKPKVVKPATRTGSRAADAALSVSDTTDSGLRRGTSGAGGRGGERDFARQAQGLGGLVHLYATFAANIYAVSAAFSALQKAADFERMEKSAARMSVVLGINLNNAAKAMVNLTDGAVSYAEAIEKTNLAASAGLSTDQMTRLAKVAKGASTALGRDMGDSLNRLVKGAVKLEPELLDELGILTKASEAYRVYGAGIGKTEDELTKFEKTQAFVNAVIAEGESKFSSLYTTIEANPYTQLQAKLQDVAKSSLSVLNTGLTPIVKVLSENPTALVGVISLLITKLVSMAIPSVTQFGDKAAASAEKAMTSFNNLNARFEQYSKAVANVKLQETLFQADAAKKAADRVKSTEAVIAANEKLSGAIAKSNKSMYGKNILEAMFNKGPVDDVTAAIDRYSKSLQKAEAMNKRIIAGERYGQQAKTNASERLSALADVQSAIKTTQFADEAHKYNNYLKEAESSLEHGLMLETKSAEVVLTRTQRRKLEAIEIAKLNAGTIKNIALSSEMGAGWKTIATEFKMGWEDLNSLLVKQSAGTVRTIIEKFKFAGTAIGTAIGGPIMSGLSMAMKGFMVYTIVKDIIGGTIASILGEAKSLAELNTAVENTRDSHKLLSDRIAEVNSLMSSGITDINAYAKAHHALGAGINTYSDSLKSLAENYRKVSLEIETGANWTKFTNWLSKGINKDALSTVSDAMARDVMGAIQLAMMKEGSTATIDIARILNVSPNDVNNLSVLSQRFKELNEQGDRLVQLRLNEYFNKMSTDSFNTESRISALNEALKEANKEADKMRSKREFKDPKYEALASEIEKALKLSSVPEEQFRLIQQAIRGMSPALIEELAKIDPALKEFFSSDTFKQDKFSALFNMDPAIEGVKTGLAQMSAMIQSFSQDQANFKISLAGVGTGEADTVKFKESGLKRLQANELALLADTRARAEAALTDTKLRALIEQEYPGISDSEKQRMIDSIISTRTKLFEQLSNDIASIPSLAGREFLSTTEGNSALSNLMAASKEKIQRFLANPTDKATEADKVKVVEAGKKLPGSLAEVKTPAQASKIPTYPKDRLQVEKAEQERLQSILRLEESRLQLVNTEVNIAKNTLGLYGQQYNALLDNQYAQEEIVLKAKQAAETDELSLRTKERIEGILADKNVANKNAEIARVKELAKQDEAALENKFKAQNKELAIKGQLLAIDKAIAAVNYNAAKQAMAKAGKELSDTVVLRKQSLQFTDMEAEALKNSYNSLLEQKKAIISVAGPESNNSKEVLDINKQLLDNLKQQYEVYKQQVIERLKLFESGQGGSPAEYFGAIGANFANQIRDGLATAQSAAQVLNTGIIAGIDNTIQELTLRLKEGNLNIQDLVKFARNQLADAFQQSAAQVLQNGWKQLITTLVPAAADPLTIATSVNTTAVATLTASINALNVTMGGQAVAAPVSGSGGGLLSFIAGMFGGAGAGAGTGALTATNAAALNTAVAPVTMVAANGGIMSEYGPLKLNKYANGGIATGPQAAIFGEGDRNEAYVPLPDNRTIPVTLSGNSGSNVSIGDTTINVTVDNNGNTQASTTSNAEIAKSLSLAIKKTVQDELMNQMRPGGMFYGSR